MSEKGVMSKRDVAQLVKDLKEEDMEPGSGIAQRVMGANVVWSVWNQIGPIETKPEVSEEEADELLAELPISYEDVAESEDSV